MKIPYYFEVNIVAQEKIICPSCHCTFCRAHATYTRKGFHRQNKAKIIEIPVQRYRCLNEDCPRCTFSILPPMALRYCRFFWPCLLAIKQAISDGSTPYRLAQYVWHVGRRVIVRAAALLDRLNTWVGGQYREVTDGAQPRELETMVKIIIRKISRIELVDRWYRHRYPLRFSYKK